MMRLWALLPELLVAGACLVLVPVAGFVRGRLRALPEWAAVGVVAAAIALTLRMVGWEPVVAFDGLYVVDGTATALKLVALSGALLTLLALRPYFRDREERAQVPVAVLFATLGALLLASSADLALLLVFLELTSFASYLLVAIVRGDPRALEATLKYLLLGLFTLAVMGYGLSFLYGLTGSLAFRDVGAALGGADRVWVALALALVLVGFGFELAIVPFHFWLPDALEGATAPAAGFVSVVPKVGAFAALLRFVAEALPDEAVRWPLVVAVAAAVAMTFANLAALQQTSLKRLLAWSSIAQAGYVLLAVAPATRARGAAAAVSYYLAAYVFMNLGAFGVAAQLERRGERDELEAYRGLGARAPFAAAVLCAALLSLAGIPPFGGFAAKVLVLEAALDGGMAWLAVVAAVNWVVALYYYVRVIARMYLEASARPGGVVPPERAWAPAHVLALAGMLVLGVLPGAVLRILNP